MPLSKLRQRHFLHRTSTQTPGKPSILYNSACAHVDAVMRIPSTRRHDVRTEGWLTLGIERVIARLQTPAKYPALPGFELYAPHVAVCVLDNHRSLPSRSSNILYLIHVALVALSHHVVPVDESQRG
jgi:hypothetical protein